MSEACKRITGRTRDKRAFHDMLGEIFDVKTVAEDIVNSACRTSIVDGDLDIEKFFDWYLQNMFSNARLWEPFMSFVILFSFQLCFNIVPHLFHFLL